MIKPKNEMPCHTCGIMTLTCITSRTRIRCYKCGFKDNLAKHYNLTIEAYNILLETQNHRCAVCGALDTECKLPGPGKHKGLVIDHCHASKRVRGLLCHACNTMLGASGDSISRLAKGIEYLAQYNIP